MSDSGICLVLLESVQSTNRELSDSYKSGQDIVGNSLGGLCIYGRSYENVEAFAGIWSIGK